MGLFDNIQIGDEVVVIGKHPAYIDKVTGVSKKQFLTLHGYHYCKEKGLRKGRGSSKYPGHCVPITENLRVRIEGRLARRRLVFINPLWLNNEQAIKVYNYLKEISIVK